MPVANNTPWERHLIGVNTVHVKRDDLCSPFPGPSFSKVRGLDRHLLRLKEKGIETVGVLDSFHSKAGWGTAWLCAELGLNCVNFYPEYKGETEIRENQKRAAIFGAELVKIKAGRQSILWYKSEYYMEDNFPRYASEMLPNGLTVPEAVNANAIEVREHTPVELKQGTWVISVSSGHIAKGICRALSDHVTDTRVIAHMGYARSIPKLRRYIDYFDLDYELLTLVNEGYGYKDRVEFDCPFPCNPYYDLKAWKWLTQNIHHLKPPVVFWNIGA